MVWRYAAAQNEFGYAVRDGRWKLVSSRYKDRQFRFDLEADAGEQHDLTAANPGTVRRLAEGYERWPRGMVAPQWLDPHGANVRKEEATREATVEAASRGEAKQ